MDTSLEWNTVVGRRLTSGHQLVEGEEEDLNNHEKTKHTEKMEKDMAEDR